MLIDYLRSHCPKNKLKNVFILKTFINQIFIEVI